MRIPRTNKGRVAGVAALLLVLFTVAYGRTMYNQIIYNAQLKGAVTGGASYATGALTTTGAITASGLITGGTVTSTGLLTASAKLAVTDTATFTAHQDGLTETLTGKQIAAVADIDSMVGLTRFQLAGRITHDTVVETTLVTGVTANSMPSLTPRTGGLGLIWATCTAGTVFTNMDSGATVGGILSYLLYNDAS